MKKKILAFSLLLVFFCSHIFSQNSHDFERNKKIVILGSSVAAGWVTSYQEKYDMQNGYAYRLARLMEPNGWEVVNISIPGFDTKSTVERFDNDVLPLEPGYVLIGLSMSNEGLETADPDTVFDSYLNGIKELIRLCKTNKIEPVVGLCYSNDNYTEEQYAYLKKMNRLINSWNIPCVNFLGVLDDGYGHFPAGYTFDPNHPNDRGHEEMFYAFVPDMFDALHSGKQKRFHWLPISEDTLHWGTDPYMLSLGEKASYSEVSYIPKDVMHSFTLAFQIKVGSKGQVAEIQTMNGIHAFSVDKKGKLIYGSPAGKIATSSNIFRDRIFWIILTHQYLTGETSLYLNDELQGTIHEQLEPLCFTLGNHWSTAGYNKLFLFRAALNHEEVTMIYKDRKYHASMELAAPLPSDDDETIGRQELANLAMSLQYAKLDPDNIQADINVLTQKVLKARNERENELKVEHRQAVEMDPSFLDQYIGTYEIEPNDNMIVVKEDDKLFLDDHGRKAEILPEGKDQFFIHYPGDILVIFNRDEEGMISGLTFSMNGREMLARRMIE